MYSGKDDKFWGGHYGALMSNAVIRVKRPGTIAENDAFVDIIQEGEVNQGRTAVRDQLAAKVLAQCQELVNKHKDEQSKL